MTETETVIVIDGKKFYYVTMFVNEFKTKENLTGFKKLMIYFDVDEMFDCKTGAIAVKSLMIICGGGSDGKVKAFKHKTIIDLFGNIQPIITSKQSKTKVRPIKANSNVWYFQISLETQKFKEIVYYPMNVLMSNNERNINLMYQNKVNIKYKNYDKKKNFRTEEFEVNI